MIDFCGHELGWKHRLKAGVGWARVLVPVKFVSVIVRREVQV